MIAIKIYASAKELSRKIKKVPKIKEIVIDEETLRVHDADEKKGSLIDDKLIDQLVGGINLRDMERTIEILKGATK